MQYTADVFGYYGNFGGAYIPEILHHNIEELNLHFDQLKNDVSFKNDFDALLKDYVGRPSPLYLATRLSDHYKTSIFLKREDLNHTGSHKINNTIGQVLLAKRMGKRKIIAETGLDSMESLQLLSAHLWIWNARYSWVKQTLQGSNPM